MPVLNPFTFDNPYYKLGRESKLANGVYGHLIREPKKGVYIYTIRSQQSGKGYVRSFLDQLLTVETAVRFPNVVNPKLASMLKEKGFSLKREHVAFLEGHVDVWVWKRR